MPSKGEAAEGDGTGRKSALETAGITAGNRAIFPAAHPKKRGKWDKKHVFFKNEPEKLLKIKNPHPKTNRNEPKNKAEKLLKTLECIKNEPERTEKQTCRSL